MNSELRAVIFEVMELLQECERNEITEKIYVISKEVMALDDDAPQSHELLEALRRLLHPRGGLGDVVLHPTKESELSFTDIAKKQSELIDRFWSL